VSDSIETKCEVIEVTREDLEAQRAEILARYGIEPGTRIAEECGCCPAVDIGWGSFQGLRDIAFLLGEDK
jgi:hypothetical protein